MSFPFTTVKKTWRDLKNHKLQVIALSVILGLGAAMLVGFEHSLIWRKEAYDGSYARLKMMDFQMDLLQETFGTITDLDAQLADVPYLEAWEFRLVLKVALNISTPSKFQIVQGKILGINVTKIRTDSQTYHPSVNDYLVKNGQDLAPSDSGQPSCLLQLGFADYHGFQPNGTIQILHSSGKQDIRIKGLAFFVEYLVLREEGVVGSSESQLGVLYMPLATVQNLFFLPGLFNQLIVRTSPNHAAEVEAALVSIFNDLGLTSETTSRDHLASYEFLYKDLGNDRIILQTISILFLIVAGLGTYVMISRVITSQRRLIGISKALGYPSSTTIGQYLLFSAAIGLLGGFLGCCLGVFIGFALTDAIKGFMSVPYWETRIHWELLIGGWLICPVVTCFSGFLPAFKASRMKPVDAIRLDPLVGPVNTVRPGISHKIIQMLPVALSIKLPLRNVFRNRRRTLSTIIGLAMSIILSVSILGLFDSLDRTIEVAETDLGRWDLRARSFGFHQEANWTIKIAERAQDIGISDWELALDLGGTLHRGSEEMDVIVSGVLSNSIMRPVKLKEGAFDENGIVISRRAASNLDVSVGDKVEFEHLTIGGPTGYFITVDTIEIIGIHESIFAPEAFMTIDLLRTLMKAPDGVNVLYLAFDNHFEIDIRKFLYNELTGSIYVESYEDLVRDNKQAVKEIKEMMLFSWLFSLIMAFAMIFNTVTANVAERNRETGTMLTLGTPKWLVARTLIVENILLAILGLILGIIVGYLTLDLLFINGVLKSTLSEIIVPTSVKPATWILLISLYIGTTGLGQLSGIRKGIGVDLAAATKTLE
jgi:putative ABC transport system permease protein